MTTNQTIDGVPRAALEILLSGKGGLAQAAAAHELRALLDKEVSGDSRAPQTQGEPVACMPVERCYDVRAKMIIAFNEAKKAGGDLDDALDAAYRSALRYSPNPLGAEQPAPVALSTETRTPFEIEHDAEPGDEAAFRKWRAERNHQTCCGSCPGGCVIQAATK